jgi:hypothetical protein
VMIFDSVQFLSKKNNQTEFKKKKPKPVQTNRFQFGSVFLDKNWFKPVWLGFDSGFLVWLSFGLIFSGLGSVQFAFFDFRLIKPKPNQSVFLKF